MSDRFRYRHALCLFPYKRHLSGINFFPPTGLEYIAGSLEGHVGRVTFVDLAVDPELKSQADLNGFIGKHGVDLVCASLNWDYHSENAIRILQALPPSVNLVVGGQTATNSADDLFGRLPNMTCLVRGEGEETIREIAAGKPFPGILGLSYVSEGKVVHNPHRPLPPASSLPNPNRRLRRAPYKVDTFDVPMLRGTFDAILGSRGCPFRCKFCTFSLNPLGQKRTYSSRPVESVLEELATVKAEYVIFSDDYFFVEPERTEEICRKIVERKLQRHFVVNARVEVARRPKMLEAAKAAGVKILLLGIESATDRILRQLNKGFNTDKVREYMKVLNSFDFFNHGYFIYGNIGESVPEMLSIAGFAREIGLDSITLSKLRAEKFSPIHDDVAATPGAWVGSTGFVYQEGLGRKDLKRIGATIRNAFYTPAQMQRIAKKAMRLNMINITDMFRVAALLPALGAAFVKRAILHQAHKRGMWND